MCTARDLSHFEGYTFGGARDPEVLRATVPKGELDGDTGLVRGERSAGLLTGQAGAGCGCLPSAPPAEPGQPRRHPANVLLAKPRPVGIFGLEVVPNTSIWGVPFTRGERPARPWYASATHLLAV